ncbi:hypothetical protein FPZ45_19930 [Cohnella terricola]|uniref:Uncharacterized protein n=2 Tax=Cohnella terricola TaxID=1289167 RepID=A0A559JAP3_9BACL|nr:DUF6157 family protein [Cohnella terricola]TVX96927.1 hypothetical protein FPZ45_19930 [Cohnella terricola]
MEWNYYDTFIKLAGDCPVERGMIPPEKKNGKSKPGIEYDLVFHQPYTYTQEELLYQTYVRHKEIPEEELASRSEEIREAFFSKPMACLRASMLPKKYGWGLHFDSEGKVALVARESEEYDRLASGDGGRLQVLAAMRNSRK